MIYVEWLSGDGEREMEGAAGATRGEKTVFVISTCAERSSDNNR